MSRVRSFPFLVLAYALEGRSFVAMPYLQQLALGKFEYWHL
jgi:hypothetical protein